MMLRLMMLALTVLGTDDATTNDEKVCTADDFADIAGTDYACTAAPGTDALSTDDAGTAGDGTADAGIDHGGCAD